jgi:hypothetical protein
MHSVHTAKRLTTSLAALLLVGNLGSRPPARCEQEIAGAHSAREIIANLERAYSAINSIFAEYEIWASDDFLAKAERKVHVLEVMDTTRRWKRTTHFYRELYDNNSRPEFDPSLNWILWSTDRDIYFQECARAATILPKSTVLERTPNPEGFFGTLGLVLPDQRASLEIKDTGFDAWTPSDFYLPFAFRLGGWELGPTEPTATHDQVLTLSRSCKFGSDKLWLDPKRAHALVKREIRGKSGQLQVRFTFNQLTEQRGGIWLPSEVVVEKSTVAPPVRFLATRVDVNSTQVSQLIPPYPPGSLILDQTTGKTSSVLGGEDLLDFTVQRAKFFLAQDSQAGRRRDYLPIYIIISIIICISFLLWCARKSVVEWARRRLSSPRNHGNTEHAKVYA